MSLTMANGKSYLNGLDGLRAISVVGVLIYHLDIAWLFPGGFLGVDVFFTLSGFLITSLIVREINEQPAFSFRRFYVRRAKRLFPAIMAMLLATWLCSLLFARDALPLLKQDLPAAALYASNWWQIFSHQSYFELSGRPRMLMHLWSLAIEEQFYIIWPLFLVLALRRWGKQAVAGITLLSALGVTAWMALLSTQYGYPADADPSRVYLGTDTHTMGLFIGALLGIVWSPWATQPVSAEAAGNRHSKWADWLGYALVASLMLIMLRVNETSEWLYQGGFLLVALISAGLIYLSSKQQLSITRLLGSSWLRWFGLRSYGLYVWHWPIFTFLRPGFELPSEMLLSSIVRLALTVVVAELSYRYVEQPFRYKNFGEIVHVRKYVATVALCLPVLIYAPQVSGFIHKDTSSQQAVGETSGVSEVSGPTVLEGMEQPAARPAGDAVASFAKDTRPNSCELPPTMQAGASKPSVTIIGDSVLLGAKDYMNRHIARLWVDAKVGRQGSEGLAVIRELKNAGKLSDTVVLHLGTNGYLAEKHMRAMLQELAGRKIVLVNIHAPRRWAEDNNDLLASLAAEFPGVRVMDWSGITAEHAEFFVADGIHLSGKGIHQYAESISNVLGMALYAENCAQQRPVAVAANQTVLAKESVKGRASDREARDGQAASAEPARKVPDPAQDHPAGAAQEHATGSQGGEGA